MIMCNICEYNMTPIYVFGYNFKTLIYLIVYCIYFHLISKYNIFMIKIYSMNILLYNIML